MQNLMGNKAVSKFMDDCVGRKAGEANPICNWAVSLTEVPEYETAARVLYAYHAKEALTEPINEAPVANPKKPNNSLAGLNFFIFSFLFV